MSQSRQPMSLIAKIALGAALAMAFWITSASSTAEAQRRQPRVIQLEEIKIEGRVQKPNAFYILNRAQLGYEVLDLRTSFIREIIRSVRRDPF